MHFSVFTPLKSFTDWTETNIKAAHDYRLTTNRDKVINGHMKQNSVEGYKKSVLILRLIQHNWDFARPTL